MAVKSLEIISKNNAEKSTLTPLHIKHSKNIGIEFFFHKCFKCDTAVDSSLPKIIKQVDFSLTLLIEFSFC